MARQNPQAVFAIVPQIASYLKLDPSIPAVCCSHVFAKEHNPTFGPAYALRRNGHAKRHRAAETRFKKPCDAAEIIEQASVSFAAFNAASDNIKIPCEALLVSILTPLYY